jgi:hypothetical protein
MFSKIECKLFPDEYSVVAPLVQALCVARSRAAMGINAELQQRQKQQQQQQQQQGDTTRISKRELRLPGDVDPDLMDSLLQVHVVYSRFRLVHVVCFIAAVCGSWSLCV